MDSDYSPALAPLKSPLPHRLNLPRTHLLKAQKQSNFINHKSVSRFDYIESGISQFPTYFLDEAVSAFLPGTSLIPVIPMKKIENWRGCVYRIDSQASASSQVVVNQVWRRWGCERWREGFQICCSPAQFPPTNARQRRLDWNVMWRGSSSTFDS